MNSKTKFCPRSVRVLFAFCSRSVLELEFQLEDENQNNRYDRDHLWTNYI